MKNKKIFRMAFLAMMMAILVIMMWTPLGYLPFGGLRITTMHIPVLITAMVLGKKEGMIMGALFGISSIVMNTLQPTLTSFVFSPFITVGNVSGNGYSLIIAVLPRILLGWSSGWIYEKLTSDKNETRSIMLSAFIGTLSNTLLVLMGIYLFFGSAYAVARGIEYSALVTVLLTTIMTNGILEILLAIVICLATVKALQTRKLKV
ncbi:ECF transporter S component [Beduini massiliensis]|uniref:ECF transporter S component n=1 Tax=Beduini massiliensis TaxID=1585974 RepID=UPI00059A7F25|nr:ECF transporter S component [Beduini massiliensis]